MRNTILSDWQMRELARLIQPNKYIWHHLDCDFKKYNKRSAFFDEAARAINYEAGMNDNSLNSSYCIRLKYIQTIIQQKSSTESQFNERSYFIFTIQFSILSLEEK